MPASALAERAPASVLAERAPAPALVLVPVGARWALAEELQVAPAPALVLVPVGARWTLDKIGEPGKHARLR